MRGVYCMLGGQAGATFDAAALEDFLTVFSAITFHEAMFDFALTLVWLIGPFWHGNSPILLFLCFNI